MESTELTIGQFLSCTSSSLPALRERLNPFCWDIIGKHASSLSQAGKVDDDPSLQYVHHSPRDLSSIVASTRRVRQSALGVCFCQTAPVQNTRVEPEGQCIGTRFANKPKPRLAKLLELFLGSDCPADMVNPRASLPKKYFLHEVRLLFVKIQEPTCWKLFFAECFDTQTVSRDLEACSERNCQKTA
jgi:hypothetical protein